MEEGIEGRGDGRCMEVRKYDFRIPFPGSGYCLLNHLLDLCV